MCRGWHVSPWFVVLLLATAVPARPVLAQDPAKERVGREASSQAAEADRLFKLGDYASALPLYQAEQKSRAELGDVRYEAYAYRGSACCLARLGQHEEAIAALKKARKLDLTLDDPGLAGYDSLLTARAYGHLGQEEQAILEAREALKRFTKGEDRDHEAEARIQLGRSLFNLGKLDESTSELNKALTIAEALEIPAILADAWRDLARVDRRNGKLGLAFERLSDARAILETDPLTALETARVDHELADVLVELGRLEAAESRLLTVVDGLDKLGNDLESAEASLALAMLRLDLKNPKGSIDAARTARNRFQTAGAELGQIDALVAEANALDLDGRAADGYETVVKAIKISDRINGDQPEEQVRLSLLAGELASRLRKPEAAAKHLEAAKRQAAHSEREALREVVRKKLESLSKPSGKP